MATRHQKLVKRLRPYWQMEAMNAVVLPVAALLVAGGRPHWTSLICLLPMMLLLVIGAAYWRAKLASIQGDGTALPLALGWIGRLQGASLVLCVIALGLVAAVWAVPGLVPRAVDRWITTGAGVLAALEYVNYYHRQLQHFDSAADFKRLLSGRGFRTAQMAADLKQSRAKRAQS